MRISTNILFIWLLSTLAMTGCSIPGMDKNTISPQNTSTQSWATQPETSSLPATKKCPVKPTDLGTPSGTGTGLVSTTGSQVKVEYALYDTCGTSIQGTREERLAFDAVIGQGTIPGFAQAMMGMQAWQTREFTLSPKDAYGEEFIEIPMTREMIQGTIVRPMDSKIYTENKPITESLGGPVDTTKIQVGSVYPSSVDPNLLMKVTAIDGDKVTYVLDTSKLPFYKKPIVAGTKVSQDGIDYEIISMSGSVMMVSQKMPDAAIFTDSEIKSGAKKKLTEKSLSLLSRFGLKVGDEVEIADILWNGEEVVLSIPNKQDLAGKSLVFSIKMVSVAK